MTNLKNSKHFETMFSKFSINSNSNAFFEQQLIYYRQRNEIHQRKKQKTLKIKTVKTKKVLIKSKTIIAFATIQKKIFIIFVIKIHDKIFSKYTNDI